MGLKQSQTGNRSTLLFSPYKLAAAWETEIQSLGNLIIADVSRDDAVNYPCFHATGSGHVIPRVRVCVKPVCWSFTLPVVLIQENALSCHEQIPQSDSCETGMIGLQRRKFCELSLVLEKKKVRRNGP